MKCARLNLQERPKSSVKRTPLPPERKEPRRYCQRRMVNPEHCEDPRWINVFQRFHCKPTVNTEEHTKEEGETSTRNEEETSTRIEEDLYLTVQNLKFQGNAPEHKRTRTNFKYKSLTNDKRHRMFVKQVVEDSFNYEEDSGSQLAGYFDDYVKYILSIDRSRPSSSKSSAEDQIISIDKEIPTQVENKCAKTVKVPPTKESKSKIPPVKVVKYDIKEVENDAPNNNGIDDAKVEYQKTGKRKSLTISRVPSPATVQVIRVDVVCNYSSSSNISDIGDQKIQPDVTKLSDKEIAKLNFKGSHFADKYLLTKTVKSVDENLSCGSKVTLLCKTFKLTDRNKFILKKSRRIVNEGTSMNKLKQFAI